MAIICFVLSILIVFQIIKIDIKINFIDISKLDIVIEFVFSIILIIFALNEKQEFSKYHHLFMIFSVFYILITYIKLYYFIKNEKKISILSIKKTLDLSQEGILILNNKLNSSDIVFINTAMYRLLEQLNIKENFIDNIKKISFEKMGESYIIFINEKYYLFSIEETEVISFEITEEYLLQKELEKENIKIEENNKNIIWTIENIDTLKKEKEIWKIKNKYHDLLGQNLSILKQYLSNEKLDNKTLKDIKFMINQMFIELDDENVFVNLENFIRLHKNTGTNINLVGKLPENESISRMFFEIIREAVTNAIKHANAKNVDIVINKDFEENNKKITLQISNNVLKPKEVFIEHEGIKGIRRKVNQIDGKIEIISNEKFIIKIEVEDKKEGQD